jgi:ribosomal protein L35
MWSRFMRLATRRPALLGRACAGQPLCRAWHALAPRAALLPPAPLPSAQSAFRPAALSSMCVFARGGKTWAPRDSNRPHKKLKLKSHSGAKKRFKQRADGLFLHGWSGKRHLNVGTHSRARRRKRLMKAVSSPGMNRKLKKLLPWGGI